MSMEDWQFDARRGGKGSTPRLTRSPSWTTWTREGRGFSNGAKQVNGTSRASIAQGESGKMCYIFLSLPE
jgi:hypothetical protein